MSNQQSNKQLSYWEKFALNVVKCGKVPRHIAFVMDGNRRYARQAGDKVLHLSGVEKIPEVIHWCYYLGVKEISLYAFSILNFRRKPEEVDILMKLFREHLIDEEKVDLMHKNGVRLQIFGNLDMLAEDLRKLIGKAVLLTKDNRGVTVNIFVAYTFTHELTDCVKTVQDGVQKGVIEVEDIDEVLLYQSLYTDFESAPEIFIRTSGPTRLSDFLTWQLRNAQIYFVDVLWPSVTLLKFLTLIFKYQIIARNDSPSSVMTTTRSKNARCHKFLQEVKGGRVSVFEKYRNL